MIDEIPVQQRASRLQAAGLPESAINGFLRDWESVRPEPADAGAASLPQASARLGQVCREGRGLLARLPAKSRRNANEKAAGHALVHLLADAV